MDLTFAQEAGKVFLWLLTLGKSELRDVRTDVEELINDLRKSLTSLYDLARVVTRLEPSELDQKSFEPIYDYFTEFYLNPQDMSAARTHCGYVERDVQRIMFKLGKLLHSDLGRWNEAKAQLGMVVSADGQILSSLEQAVGDLRIKLDQIKTALTVGDSAHARRVYTQMRAELKPHVASLGQHVDAMDRANRHLWSVTA